MTVTAAGKLESIRSVPLFSGCSKRELTAIASIVDEVDLPAGKTFTREGERGREFLILLDGTAVVRRSGRTVNTLGPGDFLGEIALFCKAPRTATVTTTSPARALVMTDRSFHALLARSREIQSKVLVALAERLAPASL